MKAPQKYSPLCLLAKYGKPFWKTIEHSVKNTSRETQRLGIRKMRSFFSKQHSNVEIKALDSTTATSGFLCQGLSCAQHRTGPMDHVVKRRIR